MLPRLGVFNQDPMGDKESKGTQGKPGKTQSILSGMFNPDPGSISKPIAYPVPLTRDMIKYLDDQSDHSADPRRNQDAPRKSAHAAARLTPVNAKGAPGIRLLDNGLDPSVPVKVQGQNKSGEGKPASNAGPSSVPNAAKDAREMEAAAKQAGLDETDKILRPGPMLNKDLAWEQAPEPSVAEKIFNGLGELADKAPAGMAEALKKGVPAMVEASGKALEALTDEEISQGIAEAFAEGIPAGGKAIKDTAMTFVCDERMHAGLKKAGLFALGGMAVPAVMIGGGYLVSLAPEVAIGLEARFPGAIQAAGDFVQGAFDKTSPPPTGPGLLGYEVGRAAEGAD